MISPGEEAPDFVLDDQAGEKVRLSDYRGRKVVLAFYPLDFSPVCTDQLSVYQEVLPDLEERGVTLLGISVDSSYAHRAFGRSLGVDIRLLADFHPKGDVARAYDAWDDRWGHSNRSLVLIDEGGVVSWVHEAPVSEVPGANLIFDALAAAD